MLDRFFSVPPGLTAEGLFEGVTLPWQLLERLGPYLGARGKAGRVEGTVSKAAVLEGPVWVGRGTVIEAGVHIKGPAVIGRECDVRHHAYLRGRVLVGDGAVIGNSCELKHAILFDEATVPHLSYVGDSVLGRGAHLGAGTILSNVKLVRSTIGVEVEGIRYDTGLEKFGAILGDGAEIGCNCVLNPGSLIGAGSLMYPLVSWRGYLAPGSAVKLEQSHRITVRRGAAPR